MTDTNTPDGVSRRSVLKTSATLAGFGILGGLGHYAWLPPTHAVGTAAGATQTGETFLEAFAGESPLLISRGEPLPGVNVNPDEPFLSVLPDARIRGPEGVLSFIPRRLADEDGQVSLEDVLVMTSARVLEGDLTAAMPGPLVPGEWMFPSEFLRWATDTDWVLGEAFVSEDGVETTRVLAFRDAEWGLNEPLFPSQWNPEGDTLIPGQEWSSLEVVEAGDSLEQAAAEGGLLFGAAGHNFFPTDRRGDFSAAWEELANAETAAVLEL